ncbi:hypothetical protein SAE02_76500 [Skermanella aerolata]|uniref:Ribbon-helix-helix protein CopG domain-containing protein n=1 Tax=Skermanella aerolata TaxID=393310 RepID=A0A512E473_9PROT|nr:DUF6364 family protein [Skermanella aerolata]KJB90327.1 hypothetical protein N826_04385 [Skermanella aerolata KACC 11604]GEO43502.1 hypothetical protein SAE02_76500 [Skermanella aerolata]
MKKAITVRIDPDLLTAAQQCARQENRSLTNLIETVLRHWISGKAAADTPVAAFSSSNTKSAMPDHD